VRFDDRLELGALQDEAMLMRDEDAISPHAAGENGPSHDPGREEDELRTDVSELGCQFLQSQLVAVTQ